jgi:hypothetical protein
MAAKVAGYSGTIFDFKRDIFARKIVIERFFDKELRRIGAARRYDVTQQMNRNCDRYHTATGHEFSDKFCSIGRMPMSEEHWAFSECHSLF